MSDLNTPETAARWAWLKRALPTNWRAFLLWALTVACMYVGNCVRSQEGKEPEPFPAPPTPLFPDSPFGWQPPSEDERRETLALLAAPRWNDTEAADIRADEEQDAPLWRFYSKVAGQPFPAHDQGPIGACVAFGTAAASEFSLAARIHLRKGAPQEFAPNVRQAIYAGSRINCDPRNPLRGGDGSTGSRASRWLQKGIGGLLPINAQDRRELTVYDSHRCREWGDRGVPNELVAICRDQPCQTTLVSSGSEARKAIQQGYAIFVCSNVGFGDVGGSAIIRDEQGFLKPRGTWMHCMCIAGFQGGQRPGFLIVNSWGSRWLGGPKGRFDDIPEGSFWSDFKTVDRMLQQGDSFAVASVEGFRKRKIDPKEWIVMNGGQSHAFVSP